jgi:maltooligosyltrehalose trehalohydrolase
VLGTGHRATFGALPQGPGVRFKIFAPNARSLRLHILTGGASGVYQPDVRENGVCESFVAGARPGDRYYYTLDDSPPRPDPASRFQPEGVHGPSEIIDPGAYAWRCASWPPVGVRELVIYELHLGTFTGQGTFAAAAERLPLLRELGVTAVELMPVAEFAGSRNWGYDSVGLFAPSHNYGRPDDLRGFVDAAHELGMAVILDVVYNHLGPEGAYLPQFHPAYIAGHHATPWGGAVNLDGPGSDLVRRFIVDSALHWVLEYQIDGLRLDATHTLVDDSPTHLVAELVTAVRAAATRPLMLHAEDHRNLVSLLEPVACGGWGLDAVWADDFHHILRRRLAGDAYGYYEDFAGTCDELARTINKGWYYTGQPSRHAGRCRGTDPADIPMHHFIACLQNHDQVGNRATGDRLHHTIEPAAWRAASTVLLTVPMTPLIFMGQEWACTAPFQYFTDLEPNLGVLVTEGRRHEFRHFPEFTDPATRHGIPDPQAASTFLDSRLNWEERETGMHRQVLALYRALLGLRHAHSALAADVANAGDALALDLNTLLMRREAPGEQWFVAARLAGSGTVGFNWSGNQITPQLVLTTEDARFASDPMPPDIELDTTHADIRFHRPGAVIISVR